MRLPPGAVTKRICGPGTGDLNVITGLTLGAGAGLDSKATALPHMIQVSAPCTRSPLHFSQYFAIKITIDYF